jgi:hypothetical protein
MKRPPVCAVEVARVIYQEKITAYAAATAAAVNKSPYDRNALGLRDLTYYQLRSLLHSGALRARINEL